MYNRSYKIYHIFIREKFIKVDKIIYGISDYKDGLNLIFYKQKKTHLEDLSL